MKKSFLIFFIAATYLGYYLYLKNYSDVLIDENKKLSSVELKKKSGLYSPKPKPKPPQKIFKVKNPKKTVQDHSKKSFLPKTVKTLAPPKKYEYDDSFVPLDDDGNMVITEVFLDGQNVVIHGDILVADLEEFNRKQMDKKPLIVRKPLVWPKGKIPYEIAEDVPDPSRILNAIKNMNQETFVTFQKRQNEKAYIYFRNGENNCYSYVGYIGRKQDISLSPHCQTREILHEMTHALGFFHEQSREDRDEFLEINWRNIEEKYQINFKKVPKHLTLVEKSTFDFDSLMLYPPNSFAMVHDEFTMVKKNGDAYEGNSIGKLSPIDIKRINSAYQSEVMK